MHERLLVGFDGSGSSAAALRWAAGEAELRHATVRVVCWSATPPLLDHYGLGSPTGSIDARRLEHAANGRVRLAIAEVAAAHPTVTFEAHVVDAPPVEELVGEGREADLLAIGRNGMGVAGNIVLGSVCRGVLAHSPCPMAVVPATGRPRRGRVVVGIDGSAPADKAARWATDEADRLGSELVVLHAWSYPYRFTNEGIGRESEIAAVDAAILVERTVAMTRDHGTGNVREQLIEGGAVQALLDAAEEAEFLVVVGSRGRGGFRGRCCSGRSR